MVLGDAISNSWETSNQGLRCTWCCVHLIKVDRPQAFSILSHTHVSLKELGELTSLELQQARSTLEDSSALASTASHSRLPCNNMVKILIQKMTIP